MFNVIDTRRDYYDYLCKSDAQYKNTLTYVRNSLNPDKFETTLCEPVYEWDSSLQIDPTFAKSIEHLIQTSCNSGKATLVQYGRFWNQHSPHRRIDLVVGLNLFTIYCDYSTLSNNSNFKAIHKLDSDNLDAAQLEIMPKLLTMVKRPVFFLNSTKIRGAHCLQVSKFEPLLVDVGVSKIVSAEKAYHMIEQGLSIILAQSCSTSAMTDSEKVLSHGFDSKKSFRHRT